MPSLTITTGLDHVGVAGRDMVHLLRCYERLGFCPTAPESLCGRDEAGNPVDLGQQSAHIMFADSYIELSAVPQVGGSNHLEHALSRYEGLHIVAFATDDAAATYGALPSPLRGASGLQRASRVVQTGSGGEASFQWFALAPEVLPEGFFCFVQHETPQVVYDGAAPEHPNGAIGLLGFTVLTQDLAAAVQRYEPLAAPAARRMTLTDELIWPSVRAPVAGLPEAPALIAMEVLVTSLSRVESHLQGEGVDYIRQGGELIVGPGPAAGCALQFSERP